jgi:hypothetical protein
MGFLGGVFDLGILSIRSGATKNDDPEAVVCFALYLCTIPLYHKKKFDSYDSQKKSKKNKKTFVCDKKSRPKVKGRDNCRHRRRQK